MRIASKTELMAEEMPKEAIEHVIKEQERECISEMLTLVETERTYKMSLHHVMAKHCGTSTWGDVYESNVYMDIEPVPELRMVYKSPEDLHLTPSKSLRTKLKNCWKYLRDNSEGRYEQEK